MAEQPETYKIIKPFTKVLKKRGWKIYNIHGNIFTGTMPDKLIFHPNYGTKLVEFKVRKGNTISLSKNQKKDWIIAGDLVNGLKFYVIAAIDLRDNIHLIERMYTKLFEPPNSEFLLNSMMYKYLF